MFYYIYPPNVLKIASNEEILEESFKVQPISQHELDLIVYIKDNSYFTSNIRKIESPLMLGRDFIISQDENQVFFIKKYLGVSFYAAARNLENEPTELLLSRNLKIMKIPLRDLPRIDNLIESFIQLKLVQKGFTKAHLAIVDSPYGGIGITAYPDVGKTTSSLLLSQKPGFKVLGDDIAIIDSKANSYGPGVSSINIFARAELISGKEVMKIKHIGLRAKIGNLFRYLDYILPFSLGIGHKLLDIRLSKIPLPFNVGQGWVKVRHLFFLENGREKVVPLSYEEAKHKFIGICVKEHYRFYFDNNPLFLAYSYVNNDFDFFELLRKRDIILSDFVKNVNSYLVRAEKPTKFSYLILNTLKEYS